MSHNRTEWVMHVWGKKRDTLELNWVEKFHLDMLKTFQDQQKMFDRILVNIALDDINNQNLFEFLKKEIGGVLVNDNIEFRYCQNDPIKGEYVTFRPYVFDRIGENVDIFYSHFKGYRTYFYIGKESFPARVIDLCEMFWSYIMYEYSLNMTDIKKKLKNNCTYSWFVLKNTDDNNYYTDYKNKLILGDDKYKDCVCDNLNKNSPGSFVWYNMKKIGESLKDKPLVNNVKEDFLVKLGLCTHFCELYLMQFLKENECYSAKDFKKEFEKMDNVLYTSIYPMKLIGREYIKDFEKYLIENKLI